MKNYPLDCNPAFSTQKNTKCVIKNKVPSNKKNMEKVNKRRDSDSH